MNVTNKYIENPQLALSVNTNSLTQHRNSSNGGSTAAGTTENKYQHFSGSETLARQQPPASASMKGISNVAAAAA
jgi:hypothetical protein